jgi:hypothetical protein
MSSARTPARTLRSTAAFVDRSGVALVFPKEDVVLPSLWQAVAGPRPVEWAVRDEDGAFVSFTREMDRVWAWKDELPGRGLTVAGKHVAGRVSLVSFGLIGSLYALTGRPGGAEDFRSVEDLSPLERDVAEAVLQEGVSTAPELHRALETPDRKRVKAAVESLERMLVLTRAGSREQDQGWPAGAYDLLARRCSVHLVDLPSPEDARRRIVAKLLNAARELSAADVTGALGWRKAQAIRALEDLADAGVASTRDEEGYRLWMARGRSS